MTFELSMGYLCIFISLMLHLGATILIVVAVRRFYFLLEKYPYVFIIIALILTNLIIFLTHLISVTMWGSLYVFVGMTDSFSDAFYSAFVTNTTLGLGDVTPEVSTRLLRPMTASSGIMMIGWSTAVLVYVVQTYLPYIAGHK